MNTRPRDGWIGMLRRLAPLLPADLFGRLRAISAPEALPEESGRAFADCVQETINALDSFHHILTTFLPRYLLDLSPTPGQPHGEVYEGSFIFADVTGFTALTGQLSKQGTAGREEMNRLMRSLFAALLDPLLASGGDLLFFAGDAALACFPAQPNGRDAPLATRTALRLVRAITPFESFETPYGTFSLTMSAGVERGRAFAGVVGTKRRMELLISGGPVQGATDAEGQGEPGEVVVGPGVLPLLDPSEFKLQGSVVQGLRAGELDDYESVPPVRRRRRLSAVLSRRIPDLLEHLEEVLAAVENLVPFIPLTLLTQLARGEDIRQHPPVAIQFVNLMGIEELALGLGGPELATAVLQRYFVQAQEVVNDREGIISQVDPYAKGFTLLNPFGAPTHHEGVPQLAASTALELARVLERVNNEFDLDPPLTQRVGMTYDRIFTGEIGYQHRREYVVAGPAVNLAARLMSKAGPGQIVLDPLAWNTIREDFVSDKLDPIPLKGIPEPVARFALQGLRRGKGLNLTDYPLAGRQEELATLEKRMDDTSAGRGSALALIGEAGIGKSRLVSALAKLAAERGMTVLTGRCQPFGQTMPYLPFADLVGHWFELDEQATPDVRRQHLRDRLAQFELAPSLPAFADLMGFPPVQSLADREGKEIAAPAGPSIFAAASQQSDIDPAGAFSFANLLALRVSESEAKQAADKGRSMWQVLRERAYIPESLRMLLERQAQIQPTLLILEDIQWMDPDSRQVLEGVIAASADRSIFVLVTARQDSEWPGEQMLLGPISNDETKALAAVALQATSLEPDLAEWMCEKAAGRPLFTLAYCRALRDGDAVAVDPATDQARWSGPPPTLPISLQELLLAQVDQLGPQAREAIRRGAVIGSTFSSEVLSHLSRKALPPAELEGVLDHIARRSLIAPPPPGPTHSFSSQSLHDAVYAALSHAQRREWHEQVGDYLAEGDDSTRYERLEQIAYHYGRGDDPLKAARFTRLAGDKARGRHADEAALSYYAQTLATRDGKGVQEEHRWAHEGSGDIHAIRGDSLHAVESYRAALRRSKKQHNPRRRAKLALLGPLTGASDPAPLEEARVNLPADSSLALWAGAALTWLYAERRDPVVAKHLCSELLTAASEPLKTVLQDGLRRLEAEEPLPPYADLFKALADSHFRLSRGGET